MVHVFIHEVFIHEVPEQPYLIVREKAEVDHLHILGTLSDRFEKTQASWAGVKHPLRDEGQQHPWSCKKGGKCNFRVQKTIHLESLDKAEVILDTNLPDEDIDELVADSKTYADALKRTVDDIIAAVEVKPSDLSARGIPHSCRRRSRQR
jgi:hypothetical protein